MKVNILNLDIKGDDRGSLIAIENRANIPFKIRRIYYIFGTKTSVRRGYHAHKNLKQLAVCVSGSCKFHVEDGKEEKEVLLDSPSKGLLIEGLVWREMYDFSSNCVLLVLANDFYDESDYIKDYNLFLRKANDSRTGRC